MGRSKRHWFNIYTSPRDRKRDIDQADLMERDTEPKSARCGASSSSFQAVQQWSSMMDPIQWDDRVI